MARKPLLEKLTSQRAEIKAATDAGRCIVYLYLRAKDSETAKAGSPYYVGISAGDHLRPFRKHRRGSSVNGTGDVPVPQSESLVRLAGVFDSEAQMYLLERALVAKYGRKAFEQDGVLLNWREGGEQAGSQVQWTPALGEKYSVSKEDWEMLSLVQKTVVGKRFRSGLRGADLWLLDLDARLILAARRLGLEPRQWAEFNSQERAKIGKRFRKGLRGEALLVDSDLRTESVKRRNREASLATAQRLGIERDAWEAMEQRVKRLVQTRFRRGKRGAELLAGIAA